MNEDLLQFIWKNRLFNQTQLATAENETITILQPGEHNHDAGPDFLNARVRIGKTTWAGNVELHVKSSDWTKHLHRYDALYKNLVLHVVYELDDATNHNCPVLELKPHIEPALLKRYALLMKQQHPVACRGLLTEVRPVVLGNCLDRMVVERLEDKCKPVSQLLQDNHNHFEETFYVLVMRSLGQKVNAWAFEQLAKTLPLKVLAKHKNNVQQLEALLLGCAGLLKQGKDAYSHELFNAFQFLKHKYKLQVLDEHAWKWMRLRPSAFPEIRMAQAAALIHRSTHLLSRLIACQTIVQARELLQVKAGEYWNDHYHLGEQSGSRSVKKLGQSTVDLLLVNAVIPFLFLYGRLQGDEMLQDKSIGWLEQLPPEKNSVISLWQELGIKAKNAADSQALLKLRQDYCNFTRCTNCLIGQEILSNKKHGHQKVSRLA